jgi:hypothetical protein
MNREEIMADPSQLAYAAVALEVVGFLAAAGLRSVWDNSKRLPDDRRKGADVQQPAFRPGSTTH